MDLLTQCRDDFFCIPVNHIVFPIISQQRDAAVVWRFHLRKAGKLLSGIVYTMAVDDMATHEVKASDIYIVSFTHNIPV